MANKRDAAVAAWKKEAGIEPAVGRKAKLLEAMSQEAYQLIRVIELEKCGIRDGDGYWSGSDALDCTVREIAELYDHLVKAPTKEER
jgi:hypothetical protein